MRDQWTRTTEAVAPEVADIAQMLRPVVPSALIARVSRLSGGLSNTNLRIDFEGRPPLVLRIYQRDRAAATVESAVLALCEQKRLPAPRVVYAADTNPVTGAPFAVLEWVEGDRLDEVMTAGAGGDLREPAVSVGATLAAIHAVTFERTGFFDAELRVPQAIDLGSAGLMAYLHQCLREGRGGERLGVALSDELFRFVEREGALLDEWKGPPCLTHSDFGGTNILVRRWKGRRQVPAVLDWEFAFSGSPFFDFGNLLRPPLGAQAEFVAGVAEGYRQAGGHLPDRWREMAAMTDLYAWAEFLNRAAVSPALIEDARRIVAALLAS